MKKTCAKLARLLTPDLDVFTCVQMARKSLANKDLQSAIACLKVDADKLRPIAPELYRFINS